jgi:hypothetical protein
MNMILPAVPKLPPDLRKVGPITDYWYSWGSEIRAGACTDVPYLGSLSNGVKRHPMH